MPKYLHDIVDAYLSNRKVVYDINVEPMLFVVERGVPQKLALGSCLWNMMYNGILHLSLLEDVELIGFADDGAMIAIAEYSNLATEKLDGAFMQA